MAFAQIRALMIKVVAHARAAAPDAADARLVRKRTWMRLGRMCSRDATRRWTHQRRSLLDVSIVVAAADHGPPREREREIDKRALFVALAVDGRPR